MDLDYSHTDVKTGRARNLTQIYEIFKYLYDIYFDFRSDIKITKTPS